ncbi:MAG: hypothetical protein A3E88_03375 [Legionellales bacterium RIFCSPHIGHO2_12_FULL_35_11]|nr:MAG: hypothetical protein A3E88_03375 [Legionellales bacterium RIFCSPHIGHO2_12_FULL_35_11]
MNKKIKVMLCAFFLVNYSLAALGDEAYLKKFLDYQMWNENLPEGIDNKFINFIDSSSPLTTKLREKWLYKLAKNNDWKNYNKYYRTSNDLSLQCYALEAQINTDGYNSSFPSNPQNNRLISQEYSASSTKLTKQFSSTVASQNKSNQTITNEITKLWLNGESLPKACEKIFTILLSNPTTNNKLVNARATLALKNRNISLARYILKQSNPKQDYKISLLDMIQKNPRRISNLTPGEFQGELYLYGLNILTRMEPEIAIKMFDKKAMSVMSKHQQQEFLANFALYKALRNKDDAIFWLNKVEKAYYTDALIDWEIRYAISHKNWRRLISLIENSKNKDDLRQKYWRARAYQALGENDKAKNIYQEISHFRNYYSFLASKKLKQQLSLENEEVIHMKNSLTIYKPIIDKIQIYFNQNETLKASRIINDFSSELNKKDRSDFAYWVQKELKWNGKSVYLCNNEELFNQLSLRFPLAYKNIVYTNSNQYHISTPLIYAIIRQESAFFDQITSAAGANGLMQIMPATAKLVAKKSKIQYQNSQDLFSPYKNINIGTAYLKLLSKGFNDNPILMIAAYNAGPTQVNRWLKSNPQKDMDIWIETIPWAETRNYVKNVIAFYAVYEYRLYNKASLNEFSHYF